MASKKKLLQAAAGSAGGAGLDVDEVFSTSLTIGDGVSGPTVVNGIDTSSEGGLIWTKNRSTAADHFLFDTERGGTYHLSTNLADAQATGPSVTFNSDGFSSANFFSSGAEYAWWTFRKAPKFFDVVTYTGTSSAKTVSHNLGSVPGMIIVKCTSGTGNWRVYHRGLDGGNAPEDYVINLNSTSAENNSSSFWNDTAPTSTEFTVGGDDDVNDFGDTYVAYLFAHNNNDGGFGPDADQDIIKCGSYTGNGSGQDINLGFEAQWVMIKPTSTTGNWTIMDVMRGMPTSGIEGRRLQANTANAEGTANYLYGMKALETGFTIDGLTANDYNKSGETYIYMAIRRGPLAEPTSATDVFDVDGWAGSGVVPNFNSGFPVDMMIHKNKSTTSAIYNSARLIQGKFLQSTSTAAEGSNTNYAFDYQDGYYGANTNSNFISWMWKRAPGYFDVVAYTGNGTAGRTVSHNLGVEPEMMWVKRRDGGTNSWLVYHKDVGNTAGLILNGTNASITGTIYWNDTTPTNSVFSLGTSTSVNGSGNTYIAYLFATLAGISKVGYWNPPSSGDLNVDCGFSNGAKLVIIKRTDFSSPWWLWDSTRGIVAGNDPYIVLQSNSIEASNYDAIDPYSAGFTIPSSAFGSIFSSGTSAKYIFYAVAA